MIIYKQWRTERDLKNQLLALNRRHLKNISQLKGQQKRYFLFKFGVFLKNYTILFSSVFVGLSFSASCASATSSTI
mgnify:CR=1 FL=1